MTVRIVTDSSCDLPRKVLEQNKIAVIPLIIHAGSREYRDGIDMPRQEFYERLPGFKPAPTTAAPGPEAFRQVYEQLAGEGATEVLSVHISRTLSAIVDIARKAAAQTTAIPVTVFDSRQLSLGTGFQVLAAAQAAARGASMSGILQSLEALIARIHVFAALDTLEFLRRSGRMNRAVSALGSLLRIKPLLKMHDGESTAERVRTRSGAMHRLAELLKEFSPYEQVALLHSNAAERARALLQQVNGLLPAAEVWLEEINPVLGVHIGPGVVGFACISKE
jgi:DegV family protein with EDD domain